MDENDKKTLAQKIAGELRKLSPRELKRRLDNFSEDQRAAAAASARSSPELMALWIENGWITDDGLPDMDNPHVRLTWTMADVYIVKALTRGNRAPLSDALPEDQRAACMDVYLNYEGDDGTHYCDIE